MDDFDPAPTAPPAGTPSPGERRLERPPSERYAAPYRPSDPASSTASRPRGLALAVVVAMGFAVLITVLGGVLLVSAGLVVLAAAGGWAVAAALRVGAGVTWTGASRAAVAVGLAMAGVCLGQVGLWLFARSEGGVLPPIDYLAQTFGILVPLQAVVAAITAAWTSR